MEYLIIILAAFGTSLLTFFSGFGLGTILTPVFALFFPLDLSIALTGVVHFLNNFFKAFLVGRFADKMVLIRFGIPAVIFAAVGAWLLIRLGKLPPLYEYHTGDRIHTITPEKIIIALLLIFFALLEVIPVLKNRSFGKNMLPVGGALSGFLGGLSGLQGAVRSAFLLKSGLSKEAYIGTAVIIACVVDITRLSVYASGFFNSGLIENIPLVMAATLSAIGGAMLGSRLIHKVTIDLIQKLVAVMLVLISLALGSGLI